MTTRLHPLAFLILLFCFLVAVPPAHGAKSRTPWSVNPVYVLINNHVEGDAGILPGDPACSALIYQTATLPAPGPGWPGASFALDITGTALIREILDGYTDAVGRTPRVLICPAGEFWHTEADATYGGRLFDVFNYLEQGDEFGIQGHGIYYSGQSFCWYLSEHTAQGIEMKLTDLHLAAQTVTHNGQPVNGGATLTGGSKLESPVLGIPQTEWLIDHVAFSLGYSISYEDHDGHVEDEPVGINNERCNYYLYEADYGDGTRMLKIDMNGSLTEECEGNTARCETSAEAIARLNATLAARAVDPDAGRIYYQAFAIHAGAIWADSNRAAAGLPMVGEGRALLTIMDTLQAWIDAGADIRFVTPAELSELYDRLAQPTSPFGFHPASVTMPGYPDNGFVDAQNIGVTWARQGVYAFWFIVQPDINLPIYDFTLYDQQWSAVPDEISILANIVPEGRIDEGYTLPGSFLPVDSAKYCNFVKATVERYDGDSLLDMPGLTNPIKYWQVGNEPNDNMTSDFAALQQMTYVAIKDACPDCQVLIGGVAGLPLDYVQLFDDGFAPILTELAGQHVDIMDFHWYGTATGEYRDVETAYHHIRDTMNALGFSPDLPFWISEMGAYSGGPANAGPNIFPYQSEEQQAMDYVKRYVHSISLGVAKVFCAFGLAEGFRLDNGYFDHTGLIYDGLGSDDLGLGAKKLGYFAYQKMTEMLEGSDWDSVQAVSTSVGNVYAYRFNKETGPVYVAWWDYFDDPSYSVGDSIQFDLLVPGWDTVVVTEAVPFDTFSTAFTQTARVINGGAATITLKESPVYIARGVGGQCCIGSSGNVNGDPGNNVDVSDLTYFVDFLFGGGSPPPCMQEADVNGSGFPDVADLSYLVDYLFRGGPPPVVCL